MTVTLTPVRVTFTLTKADGAAFTGLVDALRAFVPTTTQSGLAAVEPEPEVPATPQESTAPTSLALPSSASGLTCCVWHMSGGTTREPCGGRSFR